jgi:hypothetical protein
LIEKDILASNNSFDMPSKNIHEEFDGFLAKKGVLLPDGQHGQVHDFMDRGVKYFGSRHREVDKYHGKGTRVRAKGLRKWLNGKFNVIGQNRATDWLRAGLGHICLDDADSSLDESYSLEEVFKSGYLSMVQRKWTKARFIAT